MRKRIATFVSIILLGVGIGVSPAEAVYPNDCSQPTFFTNRVCVDPNVGGYGPILSVYTNGVLYTAYPLQVASNGSPTPLPIYIYPGQTGYTFAGIILQTGLVAVLLPDTWIANSPHILAWRMPTTGGFNYISGLLSSGSHTFVVVNKI
jgi:hypothetical protein